MFKCACAQARACVRACVRARVMIFSNPFKMSVQVLTCLLAHSLPPILSASPRAPSLPTVQTGCVLVISNEKIRIMNKARKELLAQDSCGAVTFFTTLPGPPGSVYDTVAYITRNIRLNVIRCHVFTVNSGMGSVIGTRSAVVVVSLICSVSLCLVRLGYD